MLQKTTSITKKTCGAIRIERNEHGMTLVEMLVVVAIVALLAVAAIADILTQMQDSKTALAVRDVYSAWTSLSTTAVASDKRVIKTNW
jgi:prepilin-type N-terminal cleavage/methylation domain-containing protein